MQSVVWMSRASQHKAGQWGRACPLFFLSGNAAAWHPSDGRCAEQKLRAGCESAPGLPRSKWVLHVFYSGSSAHQSHSWSLWPPVKRLTCRQSEKMTAMVEEESKRRRAGGTSIRPTFLQAAGLCHLQVALGVRENPDPVFPWETFLPCPALLLGKHRLLWLHLSLALHGGQ